MCIWQCRSVCLLIYVKIYAGKFEEWFWKPGLCKSLHVTSSLKIEDCHHGLDSWHCKFLLYQYGDVAFCSVFAGRVGIWIEISCNQKHRTHAHESQVTLRGWMGGRKGREDRRTMGGIWNLPRADFGQIGYTIGPTACRQDFQIYRAVKTADSGPTVRPFGKFRLDSASTGVCYRVDVMFS